MHWPLVLQKTTFRRETPYKAAPRELLRKPSPPCPIAVVARTGRVAGHQPHVVVMNDAPADCRIGVLALQGAFREHVTSLQSLPGVEAVEVRTKEQLDGVDGLIIPGDEPLADLRPCSPPRGVCRAFRPIVRCM